MAIHPSTEEKKKGWKKGNTNTQTHTLSKTTEVDRDPISRVDDTESVPVQMRLDDSSIFANLGY